QPLLSKFILPWFGGSPAVWTTAMLFFQVMLFAGYAYAHLLTRIFAPRWQAIVHTALLITAAALLPIAPDAAWKPTGAGEPTWRILALLVVCVGLPYLVLASTGPLVQAWYAHVYPKLSPYRLYALSNVGSLVALLSYPFYFERAFDTSGQAWWWSGGFLVFALLCAGCGWRAARASAASRRDADALAPLGPAPSWSRRLAWLALPACGSVALLATTNHVCQDVAVIPFLWVVPLALYLVTFIIAFDHERWYHRRGVALAAAVALLLSATINELPFYMNFLGELAIYFSALFLLCMLCHGELVRLKPDARRLTSFYLMIAGGGALGGILVSLVAPMVLNDFWEWPLVLATGFVLAIGLLFGPAQRDAGGKAATRPHPALLAGGGLVALGGLAAIAWSQWDTTPPVAMLRNFYGVVTVYERDADKPLEHDFAFFSGNIMHGAQYVDPAKHDHAQTYYTPPTGIARTIDFLHQSRGKIRMGVVGLGIGTLAAYAQEGDHFVFYEINPNVVMLARQYFDYLSKGGDRVGEVVLGDARISLERQQPENFDLLVLDAFSGDAIPVHLLTSEAFEIYDRHLKTAGATMVVNITNHYLDAGPVVAGLARKFGFQTARLQTVGDYDHNICRTDFMVLSRDPALIELLQAAPGSVPASDRELVWTDAHSNLFEILK
ncbi:MAG TPA: fused MFS/spermidine synthase, partial [Pirellulales bacterium]|nr:fused MFS/spermidine synthase [Pirellulales bacterium]